MPVNCAKCGITTHKRGATACVMCGHPFSEPAQTSQPENLPRGPVKCPKCGMTTHANDASICLLCNEPLPASSETSTAPQEPTPVAIAQPRHPETNHPLVNLLGVISYGVAALINVAFAVWFVIVENNSPGLSLALGLIVMPVFLLLWGTSNLWSAGFTHDSRAAGIVSFLIATFALIYCWQFFHSWVVIAIAWYVTEVAVLCVAAFSHLTARDQG